MKALTEAPGLPALHELHMQYNRIDPRGLELLQESDRLKGFQTFKSDCPADN